MAEYEHDSRTVVDTYKRKKTDWVGVIGGGILVMLVLSAIF